MGLIDGLSGVIYSNLIREGRYLLFFQGLWTTLEITAFALLLGIVIGTLVALVRVPLVLFLEYEPKDVVIAIGGACLRAVHVLPGGGHCGAAGDGDDQ